MDIDALLFEAATEVQQNDNNDTYDEDDFEQENTTTNNDIEYDKPKDTMSILKQAAQVNDREERVKIRNAFSEAAVEVVEEIAILDPTDKNKDIAAQAILLASSNEVNDYYEEIERAPAVVAPKVVHVEVESSDDENEEDDEDQLDDPVLNLELIQFTFHGKLENVKTTLKKGANYFHKDRDGWTALHWAAKQGFDEILEYLLRHVKNKQRSVKRYVNCRDTLTGWTALHVACISGQLRCVEALLHNRAKKGVLTKMRETAYEVIHPKNKHAAEIRQLLMPSSERKREESKNQESKESDRPRNNHSDRSRNASPPRNSRASPSPPARNSNTGSRRRYDESP